MKQVLYTLFLILTFAIPSFAQKNDWHTYPVRTIAEIINSHSGEVSQKADFIISANPFPSKTKAAYTGKSRPIGKRTKDFIKLWVQTRNVPASNADMLVEEFLFREQNKEYWIPVTKTLVPFFGKELKEGDEIVIYYFFLGGYDEAKLIQKDSSLSEKAKKEAASKATSKVEWVFAVEEFQKPVRAQASAYINQSLAAAKPRDSEAAKTAWLELQADLASRSSNGKHIIAENSGHYIQFDEPDLVIDSIRQVVNAVNR
jgi:hypothetical protein